MRLKKISKLVSGVILVFLILANFQFIVPPKAEAVLPSTTTVAPYAPLVGLDAAGASLGVTTDIVGNHFDYWKTIIEQIGRGAASAIVDIIMHRFVDKLLEKYKIRNYLYYDQVLTNYYLGNYISDKIQDPNLRQIFGLLNAGYITGAPTGTTGGPDPRAALIPKLRQAISDYYIKQGGIDPSLVYNPGPSVSDREYFATAQAYFANPPSFTEQNLRGQFGAFQSSATTAAQLEVIVGNGLKAGRVIGGYCTTPGDTTNTSWGNDWTPASCTSGGGQWNASALDQARSFIDNPTVMVNQWLQGGLGSIFRTEYDPNNFWYVIGKAIGSFIYNKLALTKDPTKDVLNEDPNFQYQPIGNNEGTKPGTEIDIDGDGTPDGYDIDGDGVIDICTYGGTAPDCIGSKTAFAPPIPVPGECSPVPTVAQKQESQDAIDFMTPKLEAITPMDPVVSPPPQDYKDAVQAIVDQANAKYPDVGIVYGTYSDENVIAMTFNYIVGPGTVSVSNQVPPHSDNTWINAWRVTCGSAPPPGPTCQTSPGWIACNTPDRTDLVEAIRDFQIAQGREVTGECGGFEIVKRVAWVLRGDGAGTMATFHSSKCPASGMSGDLVAFPDGSSVDIFRLNTPPAPLDITWLRNPGPPSTEPGVYYVPATDPGDPEGSY